MGTGTWPDKNARIEHVSRN